MYGSYSDVCETNDHGRKELPFQNCVHNTLSAILTEMKFFLQNKEMRENVKEYQNSEIFNILTERRSMLKGSTVPAYERKRGQNKSSIPLFCILIIKMLYEIHMLNSRGIVNVDYMVIFHKK